MKDLKELLIEKLTINKNVESNVFDGLVKAHMYAKKMFNKTNKQQFIYKTKDASYIVEENIDEHVVGDKVYDDATVVELVPEKL